MKTENEKLSSDLIHIRTILEQKTATHQRAMADLIRNYEVVEKGRIEAINEKGIIIDELNNLKYVFFFHIIHDCFSISCHDFGELNSIVQNA